MSRSLSVEVRGPVVGKQCPRFSGHAYTPERTSMAEEAIRAAWMGAHGCQSGFEGPVGVRVCFSRQLAKSSPKGRAGSPDTSRPDLDNACKLVLDALNGVAFKDDRKVVSLEAHKLPRTPHGTGDSTYVTVTYHEEG